MSQSGRPSPIHPPFASHSSGDMAQIHHRPPPPLFSAPTSFGEQRSQGPQLPPIHSVPYNRTGYDNGSCPVQLPPMQMLPSAASSLPRPNMTRSIPVSDLLSTNPPSPPDSQPAPTSNPVVYRRSPQSSYNSSPIDFRPQMHPYANPVAHRLNEVPVPFRQPQPAHAPLQYPLQPTRSTESVAHRQPSPTRSTYSSPTSYSHSETSPRTSLTPSTHHVSRVMKPPPFTYALTIRQQPAAARACGFGERDRRVIDPPPILELKITDQNGLPEIDSNAMLALNCTLLNEDGNEDQTELPASHQRLMGSLVASPYQAKDENGQAGTFFVFPDLSCRSPGTYRLRFRLIRVDPLHMLPGMTSSSVGSVVTDVFNVYTAKDFPGMRASSSLLKSLRRQGLSVGVKKGSEARKGKGKTKKEEVESSGSSSDGEGDSEGGDSEERARARSRKKAKRVNRGE